MNKFTRWQRMTVFKELLQAFDDPEGEKVTKAVLMVVRNPGTRVLMTRASQAAVPRMMTRVRMKRSILMLTLTRSSIRNLPSGRRIRKRLCLKPRNWHP